MVQLKSAFSCLWYYVGTLILHNEKEQNLFFCDRAFLVLCRPFLRARTRVSEVLIVRRAQNKANVSSNLHCQKECQGSQSRTSVYLNLDQPSRLSRILQQGARASSLKAPPRRNRRAPTERPIASLTSTTSQRL